MKRLALLLFLLWSTTSFAQYNGVKPILGEQIQNWPKGLVGYWLFNENGGSRVNDLSSNSNTGTIIGATWVASKWGACLSFDGSADAINIGQGPALNGLTTGATVVMWVYPTTAATRGLVDRSTGGGGNYGPWYIWYVSDTTFRFSLATGAAAQTIFSGATSLNAWHFVAAWFNGSTVNLQIDNVVVSEVQTVTPVDRPTVDWVLGATNAAGLYGFVGRIDNVQIWKRALTAAEIAELYRNPFGMLAGDRPELYVAAGEAPPATGGQIIIISRAATRAIEASVPVIIPLGVIGTLAWRLGRARKRAE